MTKSQKKSFWSLIVTQFFGAFNDNAFKIIVSVLIVEWVAQPAARNQLVAMQSAVFAAPFLLFSMIAGRLADRIPKPRVIVATKLWEVGVVAAGVASLWLKSIPLMMFCLFILAMQATFFSPAKYGILPELMSEGELPFANAWLNIGTFAAILIGTVVGSHFALKTPLAAGFMILATVIGLISSFFIHPLPPAKPESPLPWNPFTDLVANWRMIRADRALFLSVLAVNYVWFLGAALQTNTFLYTKEMMKAPSEMSGYLILALLVGVGVGSYLAGKLSQGKVELGLVPIGALGMSVFGLDLMWSYPSQIRTYIDFFMLGASGGFYDIPLSALIQWRSPATDRGRVVATTNFLSFVAIALSAGVLWILGTALKLNPAQVFLVFGILSLVGTATICLFLPDAMLRLVFYILTNTIYRIKIVDRENVPMKGPALLVANHLSLVDGFLVAGAIPRLIRFLIWKPYYEDFRIHWFVRTMKAIPISEKDPPKEIMRSLLVARKALEEGHLVCIFAEGEISRTGNLLEFKRGFEVIVKGMDVPVIPVLLDRVWGSIFSFEHGKVLWKKPRRIPYPVTITFGTPMKPPVESGQVRQAVLDLGTRSFSHRLEELSPLPLQFLRQAKRRPSVLAVADSNGVKWSFGQLAAVSTVFARHLEKVLSPESCVGLMLPPSCVGAMANVSISCLGRIPVNLNYTAGQQALELAVSKAGITRILTSRKLLQKTGLHATPAMVYIEDLMATLPRIQIVVERVLFAILPTRFLLKRFKGMRQVTLDQVGTILFSSGSTGIPKGVALSHANVLSNIVGLSQVFDLGPRDRILGVLPFFHSFGFTATLWFPLIHGFSAVYHSNPLDAKTVGELAAKYRATMLLSTPTFLTAYIRKCSPEQFRSLRYVVVGAERLREAVAKEFEEKFGQTPLEGYGCTELSPVATVNVPDVSMGEINQVGHKAGKIGHPIPGVSVRIVDPETFAPLPQGKAGLLLVKGPNVMKGYWEEPEKTAEVMRDGWYVTGDIASIDNDGFVQITDRLSRFSKIGGEMVPHVLVEEKLHALAGRTDRTFVVSAIPNAQRGEELVVLYAGYDGSIEDLWKRMNEADMPKLWIPSKDRFAAIAAIPYLGTGKIDMPQVHSLIKERFGAS